MQSVAVKKKSSRKWFWFVIGFVLVVLFKFFLPFSSFGKVDDWQYEHKGFDLLKDVPISQYWYLYVALIIFLIPLFIFLQGLVIRIKNAKDPVLKEKGARKIFLGLPTTLCVFIPLIVVAVVHYGYYPEDGSVSSLIVVIAIATVAVSLVGLFVKGLYIWIKYRNDPQRKKWGKSMLFFSIINTFTILATVFLMIYASISTVTNSTTSTGGGYPGSAATGWGSAAPSGVPSGSFANPLSNLGNFSKSDTIGFSVGGSKDVNSFRENIKDGFLPIPTDITYEGLFYDYKFDTGEQNECKKLFCPSYTSAISKDPFSKQDDYLLSVGLNSGIQQADFARKKLNLIIVLDISGSMDSPFNHYYYDQSGEANTENDKDMKKTKMQVATESAVALLGHLHSEDSFGMVLFDDDAYLAKPLRKIGDTDMEAIKKHILEIEPQNSTNMSAGMTEATEQFDDYLDANKDEYENRIIFLTDAQPNQGDISETGLFGIAKSNADKKIYSTFIGVGVDFNTELTDKITKVRGANYYSVNSPSEFKDRMDGGFDYMVTPLVFNLQLAVEAPGFKIEEVYGSPEADEATGEIMKVNTLFPSEKTDGETRGGLVLLHMKRISADNTIKLTASYEDRNGKKDSDSATIEFAKKPEYYDNTGIRKGIALARYVTLLKDWTMDEREIAKQKGQESIVPPPAAYYTGGIPIVDEEAVLGRWERQSEKLNISSEYKKLFAAFIPYFEREINAINDQSMGRELNVLRLLSA